MRNLTVTIPGDAYRRRGSGQPNATLPLSAVVRHQNATQKPSFSSAFQPLTQTPPVTYQYQPPIPQTKINFAGFAGETVESYINYSISIT
jgi:hypothetical protein